MASSSSHADFNYGVSSSLPTKHPTDSNKKWHYVITFETHIVNIASETTRQTLAENSIVPLRAEWLCTVYEQEAHARQHTTLTRQINSSLEKFCQSYPQGDRKWPRDEQSLSDMFEQARNELRTSFEKWKDVEVSVVTPSEYIRLEQDCDMVGCQWKPITVQGDPRVGLPDVQRCQNLCHGQSEEMQIQIWEMGGSKYKIRYPRTTRKAKRSGTQASHRAIAAEPAGYNSITNPQEYTANTNVVPSGENTRVTYCDPNTAVTHYASNTGTSYRPPQA